MLCNANKNTAQQSSSKTPGADNKPPTLNSGKKPKLNTAKASVLHHDSKVKSKQTTDVNVLYAYFKAEKDEEDEEAKTPSQS